MCLQSWVKSMTPIVIRLPHKLKYNDSIQVSPFHRWEHIFVRMLQGIYGNRRFLVYASTKSDVTVIAIFGNTFSFCEIKKSIEVLKKKIPSNLIINSEVEIINNELACLANIYNEENQICEKGLILSKDELLDFRKKAYDWGNVSIETHIEKKRTELSTNKKSSQFLIAQTRENMMDKLKDNLESGKIRAENVFVIFRFQDSKLKIMKDIWKRALEEMDAPDGYLLQKIRNHMALSFMIWPSWEEREEFIGLQIFAFIKEKNIDYFFQMICEWIIKFMEKQEVERDIIKEVLAICQISIKDLDNEIKLKAVEKSVKEIWR